jgi:hypothetical protein
MAVGSIQPRSVEAPVNRITLRRAALAPPAGSFAEDLENANQGLGVSCVFTPGITTTSDSPSPSTWPSTQFGVHLTCPVSDAEGILLTQVRAQGNGTAAYTAFVKDHGLAGRRAASQVPAQFKQEVMSDLHWR